MSTEQAAPTNVEQAADVEQVPAGSIAHAVVEKLRRLPPEKQQEVLDFVEFLAGKYAPTGPRRSLLGLFADRGISLSEEEIDELRRECWSFAPKGNS